jgi:PRC-barrel domain
MWQSVSALQGYKVDAADGEIGTVADLLFDDASSVVRWLVVDTGTWLTGRRVVLPPAVFGDADQAARRLPTALTREQVEGSPPLAEHLPVDRQMEERLSRHYGWEPYWMGPTPALMLPWGGAALAAAPPPLDREAVRQRRRSPVGDASPTCAVRRR